MKFVQPIKDTKELQHFKEYLKDRNERDYVMLKTGVNTGFRILDILSFYTGSFFQTQILQTTQYLLPDYST